MKITILAVIQERLLRLKLRKHCVRALLSIKDECLDYVAYYLLGVMVSRLDAISVMRSQVLAERNIYG